MNREIENAVDGILARVRELRHTIHQNPELAREEYETAARVRTVLGETAVELRDPFLETDVVGLLEGGKGPGANVTLRADMDALPLQEKTEVPYRSRKDGLMHACGHDGHTAMLIGAALVLDQLKGRFAGSVRFVFQPGEEVVAAGKDLVAAGALEDPAPAAILALHGWSGLPEGTLMAKGGPIMAAADFFKITILGKGGHGSRPDLAVDPIVTGARVVEALQTIVSREVSAFEPVVVTVCRFESGSNGNVIPDSAELEGTTRYFAPGQGRMISEAMERIIGGVCRSTGAKYEFTYSQAYIPTVNDDKVVRMAKKVVQDRLGKNAWRDLDHPSMGAEDFSYYLEKYPGAMLRLGLGEDHTPLHNPHFDFNDGALKNGMIFLVSAALEVLNQDGSPTV